MPLSIAILKYKGMRCCFRGRFQTGLLSKRGQNGIVSYEEVLLFSKREGGKLKGLLGISLPPFPLAVFPLFSSLPSLSLSLNNGAKILMSKDWGDAVCCQRREAGRRQAKSQTAERPCSDSQQKTCSLLVPGCLTSFMPNFAPF